MSAAAYSAATRTVTATPSGQDPAAPVTVTTAADGIPQWTAKNQGYADALHDTEPAGPDAVTLTEAVKPPVDLTSRLPTGVVTLVPLVEP